MLARGRPATHCAGVCALEYGGSLTPALSPEGRGSQSRRPAVCMCRAAWPWAMPGVVGSGHRNVWAALLPLPLGERREVRGHARHAVLALTTTRLHRCAALQHSITPAALARVGLPAASGFTPHSWYVIKAWKISRRFFQALENFSFNFSKHRKKRSNIFQALDN